jgi:F420H(2)-dependent quinone reductase
MWMARISNLLSRPRWLAKRTARLHAWLLRHTRGRFVSRNLFFAPRQRVLALTTTGRRSGNQRTTAIGYLRDGDGFALVASNSGLDSAPAWWLNLQADPKAEVDAEGERVRVKGREASPEEEERLWPKFLEQFPGFDGYRRFTKRRISVVILEPVGREADTDRS